MNFCPNCGNKLMPAAKFCPSCGFSLLSAGSAEAPPTQAKPVMPPQRESGPHSTQTNQASQLSASPGLIGRVRGIVISPDREWEAVAAEKPDVNGIMLKYVLILSLIPAIAIFVYTALIGETVFGYRIRSTSGGIVQAIIQIVSALASVYLIALVTSWLAAQFDGIKNKGRALQLIAYAMTPTWLAGFFHILPSAQTFKIIVMTIGGIYAAILIYKGLPLMMQSPRENTFGYTIAILVAALLMLLGIGFILGLAAAFILGNEGMAY